jgi:Lrp/AsnC family transcriptional regulator for asnA, asnC and gidA
MVEAGIRPKLDSIDFKILRELDLNARRPVSILSKKLGISRDVVNYRIKRLEDEKVILGFNAFVDSSKLGFKIFRVYLKFFSIRKKDYDGLVRELVENGNVFWVGEADGFTDLVFGAWFKTSFEFNEFYQVVIGKLRKFVKEFFVHEVISYSYLDRAYLLSEKGKPLERSELKIGGNSDEEIDKVDFGILKLLSANARTPIIGIAKKLGMDSASVIYRIRRLEKKKIIVGYKANLNLKLIGRNFYTVKMYLSEFKNKEKLIEYLKSLPIAVNFTESIGSWDVEFDLEVNSEEEYHNFVNDLKEKFCFISEISFYRAPILFKTINFPGITEP